MARFLPAAAVLAAFLTACQNPPPQTMPPPEVEVLAARPQTLAVHKDLVGRLSAFRSADVRARVAGVLQRRVYQEGQDVKEGEVLFTIDPAPFQAALAQAQAALAQAQANDANARVAAERARKLAPEAYVSQSDLDNAEAAERSAAAAVEAARAAVQAARINLGYATVRAPISGRADRQHVTEGALVGQGEATLLTTIEQIDPLYVNFSISLAELDALRAANIGLGQTTSVQVRLPDGSLYPHPGQLNFSSDVVDPATGAIALRATVPNPDKRLLPGTYVTVSADFGQLSGVYLLPQAAVLRDAGSAYVLVVEQGELDDGNGGKRMGETVVRRNVNLARAEGGDWVIDSGLATGERVIVSGLQRADIGSEVVPKPAGTAQPPADAAPAAAQD